MDHLGPDVERELRRFGPGAGLAKLVAAWPAAVGPAIARSAWPARFARDGTLVVHTADAVWAFELGQQAAEIVSRLGELAPKGISFTPGPLPESAAGEGEERPGLRREPTAEDAIRAESWAASIEDPELRKAVARAARASLARAADDPRSDRSF